MTELLGPEDLRALLAEIVADHPDAVNPVDEYGACLYETEDGQPTEHGVCGCIVGTLAVRQGWDLPLNNGSADNVARNLAWPVDSASRDYLTVLQLQADGYADWRDHADLSARGDLVPWGDLILDF